MVVAVETRGLSKSYGERKALDGIEIEVEQAEYFGLLGPNGGGKSTFFKILSTLIKATNGSARLFGFDVEKDEAQVRSLIGVVFQEPGLDKKLSVAENLSYQGLLYGLSGKALNARIDEVLERFKLTDRKKDMVATLSGGLARRVEIAKGMLHKPKLLLLDEPSTGLDPGARLEVQEELSELRSHDGTTILLTTHILDEAEACDRIAILDRGRVIAHGSPRELKQGLARATITIEASEPKALARDIEEELEHATRLVHQKIRIDCDDAHETGKQLTERFGERISAMTLGRPSLEDVFMAKTGADFSVREAELAAVESAKSGKRKR